MDLTPPYAEGWSIGAAQVFDDADAMAPSPGQVQAAHAPEAVISASSLAASVDGSGEFDQPMLALSKLEAIAPVGSGKSRSRDSSREFSRSGSVDGGSGSISPEHSKSGTDSSVEEAAATAATEAKSAAKPRQPSPTELVAAKLQEAAAAAAAAAAPLASNLSSIGSFASHAVPMHLLASQLQSAAVAGQSTAIATFATVTAALESSLQRDRGTKAVTRPAAKADPVEWYVGDDEETHTRYFVIQVRRNRCQTLPLRLSPMWVTFHAPCSFSRAHESAIDRRCLLYADKQNTCIRSRHAGLILLLIDAHQQV